VKADQFYLVEENTHQLKMQYFAPPR